MRAETRKTAQQAIERSEADYGAKDPKAVASLRCDEAELLALASVGDFGSVGRMTYSAVGNQTNLTARIQAHCESGKVLISHTTWALVKDKIPCEERGEIDFKGLHYPVRTYEVLEERAAGSTHV
jgi:hypothetical protein